MESIAIAPAERKDLISRMKRESKPSRRLRMHIVLLACDGRSPTEIARTLFCSRTTVYSVFGRFMHEGQAAFEDRKRRGPAPLVDDSAQGLIEELTEEALPTKRGWLRSRSGVAQTAGPGVVQGAGPGGKPRNGAPRASSAGVPLEKTSPGCAAQRPRTKAQKAREDVLRMLQRECSFFQDETKLETNPKVGFCWMRKGTQRKLPTPGTNRKVWISGALEFSTGTFHWVIAERKNDELFLKLLGELRRTYDPQRLELAVDNDASHTSKRLKRYVEDSDGGLRLHPLPAWNPASNPVELVWWSLHEAVSRNHRCKDLSELVGFAEDYLEEGQPFHLRLGEDYERLERSPP